MNKKHRVETELFKEIYRISKIACFKNVLDISLIRALSTPGLKKYDSGELKKILKEIMAEDIKKTQLALHAYEKAERAKVKGTVKKVDKTVMAGKNKVYSVLGVSGRFSMGQAAREAIKLIVKYKPDITIETLRDKFPVTVYPTLIEKPTDIVFKRKNRYFLKPEQLIQINGESYALSSQWTLPVFSEFAKLAGKQGIRIRRV